MKNFTSISEIQESISSGSTSCLALVNHYLKQIEAHKNLNIYIEVFDREAKIMAKKIDSKIQKGLGGKLAGRVIAIKDNLCDEGHKVSAASKLLSEHEALYSATVIERI